jgi:hypothetical protein
MGRFVSTDGPLLVIKQTDSNWSEYNWLILWKSTVSRSKERDQVYYAQIHNGQPMKEYLVFESQSTWGEIIPDPASI